MDIRNMPIDAPYYTFVVAIPNADHYTFLGMFADEHAAERAALEYGGIVIHNECIRGYQPPKPKKQYYTFSGFWTLGCWATDIKEAYNKLNEAELDDFDIDLDHVSIEVEEG